MNDFFACLFANGNQGSQQPAQTRCLDEKNVESEDTHFQQQKGGGEERIQRD
ncbi:MAG: hypothetical protein KQH63_10450 [Desulfobulbaceae bacterium]|nr:hypothetical protein [Desulfobulbaceae bacterium]